MTIEAIQFLPPGSGELPMLPPLDGPLEWNPAKAQATQAEPGTFAHWFTQQLQQVNGDLQAADLQLQDLAAGNAQNLHQVMISLEEARLSFQLLMQVRNRVLEAYQDVMRMQI